MCECAIGDVDMNIGAQVGIPYIKYNGWRFACSLVNDLPVHIDEQHIAQLLHNLYGQWSLYLYMSEILDGCIYFTMAQDITKCRHDGTIQARLPVYQTDAIMCTALCLKRANNAVHAVQYFDRAPFLDYRCV